MFKVVLLLVVISLADAKPTNDQQNKEVTFLPLVKSHPHRRPVEGRMTTTSVFLNLATGPHCNGVTHIFPCDSGCNELLPNTYKAFSVSGLNTPSVAGIDLFNEPGCSSGYFGTVNVNASTKCATTDDLAGAKSISCFV